ncbi:DUF423 domain-containing protein [Paenibacillus dakarensis]|uniref:DUF423 domain-containing protein n=1 Tax=Paenibacillus dakarensis TaxID=1527293 RepID=UPI0006D5A8A8|nr:DUF423 domain-containing protein [Paenibacillus dakarensis]
MQRTFMAWGAVFMALSVAIGAFGAHMLEQKISVDALATYETGVQYHMIHGIALIITGLAAGLFGESRKLFWAGVLFIAGIIIFSGSLYILSVSGIKWLGAITPIGGVSFIAGWLMLMSSAWSHKKA